MKVVQSSVSELSISKRDKGYLAERLGADDVVPRGMYREGEVHLVAYGIALAKEAREVLAHEAVGLGHRAGRAVDLPP